MSTYGGIRHIKNKRVPNDLRSKQQRGEDKDREFREGVVLEAMQFTVFHPTKSVHHCIVNIYHHNHMLDIGANVLNLSAMARTKPAKYRGTTTPSNTSWQCQGEPCETEIWRSPLMATTYLQDDRHESA